jgi:hypothetical protein
LWKSNQDTQPPIPVGDSGVDHSEKLRDSTRRPAATPPNRPCPYVPVMMLHRGRARVRETDARDMREKGKRKG